MATYVLLVKLTDKGAADIANVPERIDQSVEAWQDFSARLEPVDSASASA